MIETVNQVAKKAAPFMRHVTAKGRARTQIKNSIPALIEAGYKIMAPCSCEGYCNECRGTHMVEVGK